MIADESLFCTYCLLSLDVIGLQGVSGEIPLDRVLQGVGALEELLALLLSNRSLRSIKVFIKELPEVIGHVENLKVTGKLESRLHLLGNVAEVFLLLQDFTDQPLLAFQVVVVELLINLLEHGDPLDDIHGIEVIAIRSRPDANTNVRKNADL